MGLVAGPLACTRQLLAPEAGKAKQGLWWCLCCCWALSVSSQALTAATEDSSKLQFSLKDN